MIIDAHAHIYSEPTLLETKRTLLSAMKKYSVSFSLISNCDGAEYPSEGTPKVKRTTTLANLKKTVNFVKQHPNSLGAAIWIRPVKENGPSEELKAYVRENRDLIYALKFHPFTERTPVDSPLLESWLSYAEEEGFPVLVHTAEDEYSSIENLAKVAQKYPKTKFVAAHLQLLSNHEKGITALKNTPNLYGDTAWVPMKIAAKILREIGDDRIVFGTDNPIDGMDTLANPMYRDYFSNASRLNKLTYEKLMSGNAIKLYGLRFSKL